MYITNLRLKLSCPFDLNFMKIQTNIIIQQKQRNNDKPPTEAIALNKITSSFVVPLVSTGIESFDRKETDITVNTCPSTIISELFVIQFCNIVNSCDVE